MFIVVKLLLACFWIALIPAGVGMCFISAKKDASPIESFVLGYAALFCIGELTILPAVYFDLRLHIVVMLYGGISVCLAILGYGMYLRPGKRDAREDARLICPPSENFYLAAAVIFIILQTVVVVLFAHMDADDAFYIGTATTSVRTNSVFAVNPYTGYDYTYMPTRYVLSPFPILLAVYSTLIGNLHPAITAHMIYPAVFIPLSYMTLFLLSKRLFPRNRKGQGIFMLILSVTGWFSGYSIYNSENFRMIRIWQGKALLAGCFLPLILYLCITILLDKERRYSFLVLCMALCGACLLSSMGIMLAALTAGLFLLISIFTRRSVGRTIAGILCLAPCIALGVVYIMIR